MENKEKLTLEQSLDIAANFYGIENGQKFNLCFHFKLQMSVLITSA